MTLLLKRADELSIRALSVEEHYKTTEVGFLWDTSDMAIKFQ